MSTAPDAIRLVVGLGNPGPKYDQTRHNAGFWFADALARTTAGHFHAQSKFQGELARIALDGCELWLLKPATFMNRSGQAMRAVSAFYKLALPNVLVVHDDIDLPPGKSKLKRGGGHGGHNGLRDIFSHLGQDFWRLRLGVGHPGHRDQVIDYVLSRPGKADRQAILGAVDDALAVLPALARGELEAAMHRLHSGQSARGTGDAGQASQ